MIVEKLLDILQSMLFGAFSFVDIPLLPDSLVQYIYDFFDILDYAKQFVAFFVPPTVFNMLSPMFLALFAIDKAYPVIMWIIRKIPVSID